MIPSKQKGRGAHNGWTKGLNTKSSTIGASSSTPEYLQALKSEAVPAQKKTIQDFVFFLQESDKNLSNIPNALAKQYLELDQEFPIISGKTREYYEAILFETGSVKISHINMNRGSRNNMEIQFSKCFIVFILDPHAWGVNPNKPRRLKFLNQEYTYWDYIEAWNKAFYYQN
jgi:hypothetical protein